MLVGEKCSDGAGCRGEDSGVGSTVVIIVLVEVVVEEVLSWVHPFGWPAQFGGKVGRGAAMDVQWRLAGALALALLLLPLLKLRLALVVLESVEVLVCWLQRGCILLAELLSPGPSLPFRLSFASSCCFIDVGYVQERDGRR